MPKLKVLSLEYYMREEELSLECGVPVPDDFPLLGRDGYYCRGEDVWWESGGRGFKPKEYPGDASARSQFLYQLEHNLEAILSQREVEALETLVKVSRDGVFLKAAKQKLLKHQESVSIRETRRQTRAFFLRLDREVVVDPPGVSM
jgi:hypothetical protein